MWGGKLPKRSWRDEPPAAVFIFSMKWLAFLICCVVSTHADDVLTLRLQSRTKRPAFEFKENTQAGREQAIAAALKQQYPAFDAADPACKSLLWFFGCWTAGLTTKADISARYFEIGVENFNRCQELSALVAKTALPAEVKAAWRRRHAYELIELRLWYDIAAEVKRLDEIPTAGAKLMTDGKLPNDKRTLDVLAEINPGLDFGGSYVVPAGEAKESAPHAVIPVGEGRVRVYWYRYDSTMPVLVPEQKWLAARAAALPEPIEVAAGKPAWKVEKWTTALKGGAPLEFHVTLDGSRIVNAWAATPTMHNRAHRVFVDGGKLMVTIGKDALTFEKSALKAEKAESATDALREDWPAWRGADGRNASAAKGLELVDDFDQAKLAWVSDEELPTGRGPDTRGKQRKVVGAPLTGGWASPVVADGRVFQFYYVPSGNSYSWGVEKLIKDDADRAAYRIHLVDADDVVQCFDARTGRTLWKRVFPLAGLNYASFNKSGPQLTPCVAGGRVFAMGSAGRMYGLDAQTGTLLWQTDIGRRAEIMENHRAYLKSVGQQYGARSDMNTALTAAGSVVVTCDHSWTKGGDKNFRYEIASGLMAFDQKTGKVRWHLPGLGTAGASRWREYLLASTKEGAICIEPETGKIIWTLPDTGGPGLLPVGDDYLVCNTGGKKKEGALACYRLSPQKQELVWELPSGTAYSDYVSPVIMDGYVFTGRKQMTCIELATGKVKETSASGPSGSLMGGSGRLLYWTDLGHTAPSAVLAVAEPGKMTAKPFVLNVAGPYDTTIHFPMVDGRFIVRLSDRLACHDLRAANAVRNWPHRASPVTAPPPVPAAAGAAETSPGLD